MKFYDAMQLGASTLKPMIKETKDEKLKGKYKTALIVKDFLCLLFCLVIVITFSSVFGEENSIVGVVTILCLLTFRFSNFDFCAKQSAGAMFGIFIIFMIFPYIATLVNPILAAIINFISIMIIVIVSCNNVLLANQSTLVLSYLLLYGYEVNNVNVYINRVFGLIVSGVIVTSIFYLKNRKNQFENKFSDIIKNIDFTSDRTKWQLKLCLGICTGMLIGEILHMPRTMWIGFACMSILQPTQEKLDVRYKERPPFVVIGCLLFAVIYLCLSEGIRGNIGMIGGLMVGVSATYKWQTSFNCFGALVAAVPVLGLQGAIFFRIVNNIFGAVYSKIFNKIYDTMHEIIFDKNSLTELG